MHQWGDEGVDWAGIDRAAYEIAEYCMKWGRITCNGKEKYGTVRVYINFIYGSLHELTHPGHYFIRYGKVLRWLDYRVFGPLIRVSRFPRLMHHWQYFIYNRAYQLALKKYPHLAEEILVCSDYPELIKGAEQILEARRNRVDKEEGP